MYLMLVLTLATINLSCDGFPEPPDLHPHDVDLVHQVCGEFKVVDKENLVFEFVQDHKLEKCDGYFAISPEEIQSLRLYLKEVRRTWAKKCN